MIKNWKLFKESLNEFNHKFFKDFGFTYQYIYDKLIEQIGDESWVEDEIQYYFNNLEDLYKNGGKVFRLVFLNDIDDLDSENLGNHWTGDPSNLSRFSDMLGENELRTGDNPFIIEATINPKEIDIKSSINQFLELPYECEINLLKNPDKFKIYNYSDLSL
jgi:hypothetical protein